MKINTPQRYQNLRVNITNQKDQTHKYNQNKIYLYQNFNNHKRKNSHIIFISLGLVNRLIKKPHQIISLNQLYFKMIIINKTVPRTERR